MVNLRQFIGKIALKKARCGFIFAPGFLDSINFLLYLRSLYKLTSFYHVCIISDIYQNFLFRNIFFIFTQVKSYFFLLSWRIFGYRDS